MSASVGAYMYLRTGEGLHRTDRLFSVGSPVHRFGLMAWGNRGSVDVKTLTIETVDRARPTTFFFSFDVEAAAHRAARNPIDALVWGKVGDGEYGIRRICDVLEQHGLTGNFLIDFATCGSDGDAALRRVVDFLASRGHEIHMHLHPAGLARSWGLRSASGTQIHFDTARYDMSRRLLYFAMSRYEKVVGKIPRLFRSGAYRMNPDLVLAAGSLGLAALSNVRADAVNDGIGGDVVSSREPFEWENGVLEIPVDVSSPEVGSFGDYLRKYDATVNRKSYERTFNVVMHSFSLIRRNAQGIHDTFAPEYEETFQQMCQHAAQQGGAYGYGDYLDTRSLSRPVLATTRIRSGEPAWPAYLTPVDDGANCNVCDAIFARSRMTSDSCPACGADRHYRQLKNVLDTFGNVFDGRSVLAYQITPSARRVFLARASEVLNIGLQSSHDLDLVVDVHDMEAIEDESYSCFLGLDLLGHVKDDTKATLEIARVLQAGGLFVSTAPFLAIEMPGRDDGTRLDGSVVLERGTGYCRRYAPSDYLDLLSKAFTVSSVPGLDPVTNISSRIFLGYKR